MDTPNSDKTSRPPGCESCSKCDHSHEMPCNVSGGLSGWALATAAFFVFVLPVGLAILGAILLRRDTNSQVLGALAGFVVGVLLAAIVARLLRRRIRDHAEPSCSSTDSKEG